MTTTRKPAALHFVWNVDLSITVKVLGKKAFRTTKYFAKEEAESFAKGYFGDFPHDVRWTFVRSKKVAA